MSVALVNAARLKPEIRLAQALSEFCASLGESRALKFKTLRTRSPPTPQDVITLTEEINRDGSRNHRTWRPYATRMAMFLDKVQTLSRIGDFMVASSQNIMASGIWATVKITLGIAVGSLSFFKRISELFLKVGRLSSITQDLVQVFPKSKELQDLMCEYLITLVLFCKDVIRVLNKPAIIQLASPFIAFFDQEAAKFEADLTHLSTAIDRKVTVLLSQTHVSSANTITKISQSLAQWSATSEAKKQQALIALSTQVQDRLSSRSHQQQRIAAWRRQRKKGDTYWVLEDESYQKWKNTPIWSDDLTETLYIHGKLGSGKTVLLANIVADLYKLEHPSKLPVIIAYFFCNQDYAGTWNTTEVILGSLFQQILSQLKLAHPCVVGMDKLFQGSESGHPSIEEQINVMQTHLRDCVCFFVIDALDEYDTGISGTVIRHLLSFMPASKVARRLCFSCRTGGSIERMLKDVLSDRHPFIHRLIEITVTNDASEAEMRAFVEAEFERRRDIRKLDKTLEDILKDVLVMASEGMYLWVALQIEALFPLHAASLLSMTDIVLLLENPPKYLGEAFDNALSRISDTRYGKKIFQLVATAKRPLTLAELRIALHVQPGETDWATMALSLPVDARAIVGVCGGGLLETDEEDDTVRFIHHSVVQHLQGPRSDQGPGPYQFHEYEADVEMGFICTTYLNYTLFNTALMTVDKHTIKPEHLTNKITEVINDSYPDTGTNITSKVISMMTRKRRDKEQPRDARIQIGQLLQRYLRPDVESLEVMAFSDYAHEHWIWHANRLWVRRDSVRYPLVDKGSGPYCLFKTLLTSTPHHIKLPWGELGHGETIEEIPRSESALSQVNLPGLISSSLKAPEPDHHRFLWAVKHRHFGILLEHMILTNEDLASYIYATIHRAIRIRPYDKDPSRFEILNETPPELLEEIFIAAMEHCLSALPRGGSGTYVGRADRAGTLMRLLQNYSLQQDHNFVNWSSRLPEALESFHHSESSWIELSDTFDGPSNGSELRDIYHPVRVIVRELN